VLKVNLKKSSFMAKIIVWFRNDLRLHDHEPILRASQKTNDILPIYCFDPRHFAPTDLGFPKTDSFRAQFILESVANLRANLQKIGSDLLIRIGKPEEIIPQIAQKWHATAVYGSKEVTEEEIRVETALEKNLWELKIPINFFWTSTLYHVEDLPFSVNKLPDIFTQFRKNVENQVKIRPILPAPQAFALPKNLLMGDLPTLADLCLVGLKPHPQRVINFVGGETSALARLHEYLWETQSLKKYKETRDGLLGSNYSSKFSAWLALGCISPRQVYTEVKRFEAEICQNESTYWLIFELLWRDYFRLVAKKYGKQIFQKSGIKNQLNQQLLDNQELFEKWCLGETGIPFIDANMIELNSTGFMSNRGRQNVASFLVKDLNINWLWGAMYFESKLIDYDVCSNWGNWTYVAGVGNDPRENRYFNIISQAKRYDPQGQYVKCWLPKLTNLSSSIVHHPQLNFKEQKELKLQIGKDYPHPLVNFNKWL
jgi:deoxyribodipyrimidine photo-lyase